MSWDLVVAWVLTYAVHSTILLGAAWLGLRVLRSASPLVREAAWRVALFGGIATATLQTGFGVEPLGGRLALPASPRMERTIGVPLRAPRDSRASGTPAELARPASSRCLDPGNDLDSTDTPAFPVHLVESAEAGSRARQDARLRGLAGGSARAARHPEPERADFLFAGWSFLDLGLAAWLGAVVVPGTLALLLAIYRLRRGLAGRQRLAAGDPARRVLDELLRRSGLRRRVLLSSSEKIAVPITFGVVRPEICIPSRALVALGESESEAMLAHELGHIARRDPLWRLAGRAVVSLFLFQPLNRVALRELSDAAEYLSDDWAIAHTGRELALASCLTEVASWISCDRRVDLADGLAPGMAEGSRRLGGRVRRLLDGDVRRRPRGRRPGLPSVFGAVVLLGVLAVAPGFATESTTVDRETPARPSAEGARVRPATSDSSLTVAPTPVAVAPDAPVDLAADTVGPMLPTDSAVSEDSGRVATDDARALVGALDERISELEHEVASLRDAVLGLADPGPFLHGVKKIEQRIALLKKRREELVSGLRALVGSSVDSVREPATTEKTKARRIER